MAENTYGDGVVSASGTCDETVHVDPAVFDEWSPADITRIVVGDEVVYDRDRDGPVRPPVEPNPKRRHDVHVHSSLLRAERGEGGA